VSVYEDLLRAVELVNRRYVLLCHPDDVERIRELVGQCASIERVDQSDLVPRGTTFLVWASIKLGE